MRKSITVITMMLCLVSSLIFAAGAQETAPASKTGEETIDKSQEIIIYTNSGSSGRAEWLTERAAQDGYKLNIVFGGAGEITNRVIAERNNPVADMIYGLNNIEWSKIKNANLLLEYRPTWADQIDTSLGDNATYYPIVVQPLVLMYNTSMTNPPKDWNDLIKPEYKNKFTMLRLTGGTAKNLLSGLCSRYKDPNGVDGVSAEGWDFIKKLYQNAHMEVQGEDYVGYVVDGSIPVSEMWGSGVIQYQKERNVKFGIVASEAGVPYVVEQVGILNTTKHAALVKDFINWFGSEKIQGEWCQKFGSMPVQKGALANASDDIKEFMGKVHSQSLDWSWIAANVDTWAEKVELEFLK